MRVWIDDLWPLPEGYDLHVLDALAAINALKTGKVTLISFDHDLGAKDPAENGHMVAMWIEQEAERGTLARLEWRIHSASPAGRKKIETAMRNAEHHWGA